MSILKYADKAEVDQDYLKSCLSFARTTLVRAGRDVLPFFRTNLESHSKLKDGFDPVTVADQNSETMIREEIRRRFPEHGI